MDGYIVRYGDSLLYQGGDAQAAHSLRLNGKKLSLVSCDGTILSTVTLP